MTKEQIINDNLKAMALVAYNYQCLAKDPNCRFPEHFKVKAEESLDSLIEYIKNPEETA